MTGEAPRGCARTGCGRAVVDNGDLDHDVLCGACITRLEAALRAIVGDPHHLDQHGHPLPGLAADLEVTRTRQDRTRPAAGPVVATSPEPALPWRPRADQAAAALWQAMADTYTAVAPQPPCDCLEALVGPWCYDADVARSQWLEPPLTLETLTGWLLTRVDLIAEHPAAGDWAARIIDAVAAGHRAIDNPPDLLTLGPCDTCGEHLAGHPDRDTIRCRLCDTPHDVATRRAHLLNALRGHPATIVEMSRGLPRLVGEDLSRSRLGMIILRHGLEPADHKGRPRRRDGRGRPRYRIGAVLDVLARSAADTAAAQAARAAARLTREHAPTEQADETSTDPTDEASDEAHRAS